MKIYVQGIVFGILSLLSALLINGIPFGSGIIEIANTIVLVIGAITVILCGIFKKKYTAALIISAVYLIFSFILTMIIELNMSGFTLVGIGFVPGLSVAITGLVTSMQLKGEKKILAGIILNSLGILFGLASLVLSVINGFIIG